MNDLSAPRDFSGIRAVITGGASGIGAAIARALAARGGHVVIADIADTRAAELAASIGQRARAYHCDVTDRTELAVLARSVTDMFGGIDLVFVNAGVAVQSSLAEMDPREFDWLVDLNLRGAFNTVRAFSNMLVAQAKAGRRPRFIFTGSENSVGLPELGVLTAYTATKHAILGMADGLRRDFANQGVGVSILCPAAVNTRLWDARSTRQDRYGGPAHVPDDIAAALTEGFASFGQDPDLTARLCLEGVANDEFLIFTHPEIRTLVQKRTQEIEVALDRLNERLANSAKDRPTER